MGIDSLKHKGDKEELTKKLNLILDEINEKSAKVLTDKTILPQFSNYMNRYLAGDIKREEYKILYSLDNLHLVQVEYFTAVIDYHKDLDWSQSRSFVSGTSLFDDVKVSA